MSSYWMPLASLCIWPVPGAPGSAGVVVAAGAGVVVAGVVVAGVAVAGVVAAGAVVAVVLCSLVVLLFSVVCLQLVASTSSTPRARYRFDMRLSFRVGRSASSHIATTSAT